MSESESESESLPTATQAPRVRVHERARPPRLRALLRLALLALTVPLCWSIYATYAFWTDSLLESHALAEREGQAAAAELAAQLEVHMQRAATLAAEVGELPRAGGERDDEALAESIRAVLAQTDTAYGITVAFEPGQGPLADERGLWAPYLTWSGSNAYRHDVTYDYTVQTDGGPRTHWYRDTIETGQAQWAAPFWGTASGAWVSTYGVPVWRGQGADRRPVGVVLFVAERQSLRDALADHDFAHDGYRFVVAPGEPGQEPTPLLHPAIHVRNAEDAGALEGAGFLRAVGSRATETWSATNDPVLGNDVWVAQVELAQVLGATSPAVPDWRVGVVVPRLSVVQQQGLRARIVLVMSLAIAWLLTALGLGLTHSSRRHGGLVSLSTTLLVAGVVLFIWGTIPADRGGGENSRRYFDSAAVREPLTHLDEDIYSVITGLSLLSLRLEGSDRVEVVGYAWQTYHPDIGAHLVDSDDGQARGFPGLGPPQTKGFFFSNAAAFERSQAFCYRHYPELANDRSPFFDLEECDEYVTAGGTDDRGHYDFEAIGWRFVTTLQQDFDYSRYPFDHKRVVMRMSHDDFEKDVVMLPDVESYPSLVPGLMPGSMLESSPPGWNIEESYFAYQIFEAPARFGVRHEAKAGYPELRYVVVLRRHVYDAFVEHLLPLGVIAILMFVILGRYREKANVVELASIAASLFFVIVLTHAGLRSGVQSSTFMYIEFFYLLMYVSVLGVPLLLIAADSAEDGTVGRRVLGAARDWGHLFYWPGLAVAVLGWTVWVFV